MKIKVHYSRKIPGAEQYSMEEYGTELEQEIPEGTSTTDALDALQGIAREWVNAQVSEAQVGIREARANQAPAPAPAPQQQSVPSPAPAPSPAPQQTQPATVPGVQQGAPQPVPVGPTAAGGPSEFDRLVERAGSMCGYRPDQRIGEDKFAPTFAEVMLKAMASFKGRDGGTVGLNTHPEKGTPTWASLHDKSPQRAASTLERMQKLVKMLEVGDAQAVQFDRWNSKEKRADWFTLPLNPQQQQQTFQAPPPNQGWNDQDPPF